MSFFDFRPYGPSADAPASFISTPVMKNGERAGVLVFQMPIDAINAIMTRSSGLGETGEAVLVGRDGLMRNDSGFTPDGDILSTRLRSEAVEAALAGDTRVAMDSGYRDITTLQAAVPLNFHGANWAVTAIQGHDEIMAPLAQMKNHHACDRRRPRGDRPRWWLLRCAHPDAPDGSSLRIDEKPLPRGALTFLSRARNVAMSSEP